MEITDLNDRIRATLDLREIADPYVVATYVLNALGPSEYREAFAICLPAQVKSVIHSRRSRTFKRMPSLREKASVNEALPGFYVPSLAVVLERIQRLGLLDERVFVGGGWAFLGDCTSDDLRELASAHDMLAVENHVRAASYRELADVLDANGLRTLREAELPAERPSFA